MRTNQKFAMALLAATALAAASFGSVPDSGAMWGPMISGLQGRYYDNITGTSPNVEIDTSKLKHEEPVDDINFSWGSAAPYSDMGRDTFGVIWTGYLTIPASGVNWQIGLQTDDGSRVWIDGNPVYVGSPPRYNWFDHAHPGSPVWSSPVNLSPGPHTLRVEFYESGGDAVAKVWWQSSTQAAQIIPASAFTHCEADSVCDDSNPCTADKCGTERENFGFCVHSPAAANTVCRDAAGLCDVAEVCDGASTQCPADAVKAVGTGCRATAGLCDVAEVCDGASTQCPADAVKAVGTVCRGGTAACDATEVCDGASAQCPNDGAKPAGTVCRDVAGACDWPEKCDGVSMQCPADAFRGAGFVCRGATGACDLAEMCSGTSAQCPNDGAKPKGTVCRTDVGPCDVIESCDGVTMQCPGDGFKSAGTACRAASSSCDAADTCSGTSADCPDLRAPNGQSCMYTPSPGTRSVAGTCCCGQCGGGTCDVQCPD